MKFKSKISFFALVSSILLSINTPVFAEGGHYGYGMPPTVTNLSATLTGATGFTGTGTIRYFYNSSNNNSNLQANILLPVDGMTIKDSNTAVSSTYTLTISNGASVVTTCALVISDIDVVYNTAATPITQTKTAQYQASISENGATVTASIGSCSALPALAASDTISVSLTGASAGSSILNGTLAATVGHNGYR